MCRCRAEALALKDAAEASELRAEAAKLRTGTDAMVEPHIRKNVSERGTYSSYLTRTARRTRSRRFFYEICFWSFEGFVGISWGVTGVHHQTKSGVSCYQGGVLGSLTIVPYCTVTLYDSTPSPSTEIVQSVLLPRRVQRPDGPAIKRS